MNEIIFPYQLDNDYYTRVKDFGDAFIDYSKKFHFKNDEESLEALCIGVYWYLYASTALDLNSNIHQALANLSEYRRAFPEDKMFIDELRGKLLTKFLFKAFKKNNEKLNGDNLELLINFLEATGDYVDQISHFRNFDHDLDDCLSLTGSVRNTVQKPNPNFNIENKSKLFSSFINSINFFHLIIL